jgi:DNA-binding response OmpR family regulator
MNFGARVSSASSASALRRASPEIRSSTLEAGDLRMDLLTRSVTRAGTAITLTNKEFELLEYLLRSRGRVVSRVILTEHIWDRDFDSDTNVVDVLVNRLRRKVDDGFPRKMIHTVRGVGYVLKAAAGEDPA